MSVIPRREPPCERPIADDRGCPTEEPCLERSTRGPPRAARPIPCPSGWHRCPVCACPRLLARATWRHISESPAEVGGSGVPATKHREGFFHEFSRRGSAGVLETACSHSAASGLCPIRTARRPPSLSGLLGRPPSPPSEAGRSCRCCSR